MTWISSSARLVMTLSRHKRWHMIDCTDFFTQSFMSTATWSLRLRPVWILRPASPMSSVRRRSLTLCTSSSSSRNSIVPLVHSFKIISKPCFISASSCSSSILISFNTSAYAKLPSISSAKSRLSTFNELFNCWRSTSIDVNLPPHPHSFVDSVMFNLCLTQTSLYSLARRVEFPTTYWNMIIST